MALEVQAGKKRKAPSEGGDKDESEGTTDGQEKSKDSETEPRLKKKQVNWYDSIRRCIVTNDDTPESIVRLVGLKSLFAKQLPKMPRGYIVRLVFDRNHKSLALLSSDPAHAGGDEEIIGGICYRPYPDMKFAEIAFCAVSASQQVKGYGTKLMNLLKHHVVTEGIEYFITYADNYAIGYFKKQGFTKNITMPRERYKGLIKEYDDSTMMECYIHPSIDFTRVPEMLAAQREFIMKRVRLTSTSDKIVYNALPKDFRPIAPDGNTSRQSGYATRALAIPGVAEAGWTVADLQATAGGGKDGDRQKSAMKTELLNILKKVDEQQFAWPFREPVDTTEVEDYLEVVKDPIDLSTIFKRLKREDYYRTKHLLYTDLIRMVNNCKLYNESASLFYTCAVQLEQYLSTLFPEEVGKGK